MSPTILRVKGYRFFFFSREEPRKHIHVACADGEVKFWLEPMIQLAVNHGLGAVQLHEIEHIIEEYYAVFLESWDKRSQG